MYRFRSKGVAATEAVLAFGLLLFVILFLWSLARIVYDQTNLETATRFAAQAALASYIQNAPVSCTYNDAINGEVADTDTAEGRRQYKCYEARRIAGTNAQSVLDINTNENPTRSLANENDFREQGSSSTGGYGDMTSYVLSDEDLMSLRGPEGIDIQCSPLVEGLTPAFSENGCELNSDDILNVQAVIFRVHIQTSGESIDRGFLGEVLNFFGNFDSSASAYGWRRINE